MIFKEAINNAVKYSQATTVAIQLRESSGTLTLEVSDNGRGFDLASVQRGNGLNNMQMRARELGGELVIQSAPGQGTRIRLTFKPDL